MQEYDTNEYLESVMHRFVILLSRHIAVMESWSRGSDDFDIENLRPEFRNGNEQNQISQDVLKFESTYLAIILFLAPLFGLSVSDLSVLLMTLKTFSS